MNARTRTVAVRQYVLLAVLVVAILAAIAATLSAR
jgi:hypothetical protein